MRGRTLGLALLAATAVGSSSARAGNALCVEVTVTTQAGTEGTGPTCPATMPVFGTSAHEVTVGPNAGVTVTVILTTP